MKNIVPKLSIILAMVSGIILTSSFTFAVSENSSKDFPFRDTSLPIEKRIDDLISRMTIEEKITQLCNDSPAIDRLGIPPYFWWNECVHGVMGRDVTVFPHAIALAAMWNPDLLNKIAVVISDEARAIYRPDGSNGGIASGGLTYWSPMINMARDPRWGRTQESYGEDPYLASRLGVAFVKGLQGDDPKYLKLVATPKHFAANNEEYRRHSGSSEVPEEVLREYYLPHFKACIMEGKAQSIMGAYNAVNGIPCCANTKLLIDILRGEWGFNGCVVSDCGAISDIHLNHHYTATSEQAAAVALRAGCDLNCGIPPKQYVDDYLLKALNKGLVTQDEIDLALSRVLRARFMLGMFDPFESVPYNRIPKSVVDSPKHRKLARQASCESIVLLKNDKSFLPLDKNKLKSLVVIGPYADILCLGNYSGKPTKGVTMLEGIKNKIGSKVQVRYAPGCARTGSLEPIESIYLRPEGGDSNKHGLKAEYFDNKNLEGTPKLVRVDEKVQFDWADTSPVPQMPKDYFSVRWTGKIISPTTGTFTISAGSDDGIRLFINDQKIIDSWLVRGFTTDRAEIKLNKGQEYSIRLEYFENEKDAGVSLGWSAGIDKDQAIAEAARTAASSDIAVVVLGFDDTLEGEEHDRADLDLPQAQNELIQAVYKANPRTAVVLINGSAVTINWIKDNIPAILDAWYCGEEGGNAVADVLFGDYNPSARLPLTFYASMSQLLPFDDYDIRKGRTYMYLKDEPLYAFGYGLSYTTFSYSNLKIGQEKIEPADSAKIYVDIKNTGKRFGQEVVQLYIHNVEASVPRPLKQLCGFRKIALKPGERKTLEFQLPWDSLAFYDVKNKKFTVEPGRFDIMIGSSSDNIKLKGSLEAVY
ncbi:MAG: glycoside hydrolase family 3 C-terminal domain-containing protein [Phycisphaerae bacterium]|jgi:beta-glucosidase